MTYLPFFVHAKLLAGSNSAIFGSHNFSETGVRGGTEELALLSGNPVLLDNLNNFVNGLKEKAK